MRTAAHSRPYVPAAFAERFTPAQLRVIAHVKRLGEAFFGDAEFRARLQAAGAGADALARAEGFEASPSALAPLLSPPGSGVPETGAPELALWREWAAFRHERRLLELSADADPAYASWWGRQRERCRFEVGSSNAEGIVHFSVAVELSTGCSVGCWFCGVSAAKFAGHFAHTPANAALFRAAMEALGGFLGGSLRRALLYWATDPTDNPDYHLFLEDFLDVSGTLPQTTVARPAKDPAWTRRVLALRRRNADVVDRFSILTTADLRAVHRAFTPEELTLVDLVLQNKGAIGEKKSASGRAEEAGRRAARRGQDLKVTEEQPTIACVSGFLLNMMERSIKLVTPCRATPAWPMGYRVLAEGRFEGGADVAAFARRCAEGPLNGPSGPLAFHRDASYLPDAAGFTLRSRFQERRLEGADAAAVGALVARGGVQPEALVGEAAAAGVEPVAAAAILERLRSRGLLDEDPAPR
jgi:radical SAM family RiPP maturation amino acid epimerase